MTFWHNRWQTQQIGWHRDAYNDLLTKHWERIGSNKGDQVLVPLCGKSLDMLWFASQGYTVVGLEMVEEAIQAFFEENNLDVVRETIHEQIHHTSEPFTIIEGDIFNLKTVIIQANAWYDRAAMIAIPPTMRENYVKQIRQLTKPNAVGLLITFTYPQEEMEGPPFSLSDNDVKVLFSNGFEVECLDQLDLTDEKGRGLSQVTSSVFRIRRVSSNPVGT